MRLLRTRHVLYLSLILILNCIIVSDYFFHGTKAANFDAIAHITTIAQFHKALSHGEFPVTWGDGFANYGLPLGTIAHQLPAYIGGLLTFATHDPLLSFNVLYLVTAVLSAVLFYLFVSRFLTPEASLLAVIAYSLAPYRIMNLYMRGAMPEFASAVWVPVLLLGIWGVRKYGSIRWYGVITMGALGMVLTHPMMLIVYAPIVGLWMILQYGLHVRLWAKTLLCGLCALALSAYYLLPLNLEVKYLYYGSMETHYSTNQTTTLDSFINPFWRYNCTYRNDIFGRCQLPKGGVAETIIMLVASVIGALTLIRHRIQSRLLKPVVEGWYRFLTAHRLQTLYIFVVLGGLISVVASTSLFEPLYQRIDMLGSIQYPWRFLSAYLFFPPIAMAVIYERYKETKIAQYFWYFIVAFFIFSRFPQLYGKNYTYVPREDYYFTRYNLHSLTMNTIWSGDSDSYPTRRQKATIEQGEGVIVSRQIWNARRRYEIRAKSEVNVSDNTFYFPGWKVLVDGREAPIEFQDPAYRGVITFRVPPGVHTVDVLYTDTRVRMTGKIITLISAMLISTGIAIHASSLRKS